MKKLKLLLLVLSFQLNGFSQVCELVDGESVTIEFSNFSVTNVTDNGSDCTLNYTLDYIVNNPNGCGVNFQAVAMTDAGSQTTFTINGDGMWHTQTGTIHNTACSGNSFIQISGGWGHPCSHVGISWPGKTCASVSYAAPGLPVELIDFSARKNSNQIDLFWTTATEIENKLFVIEQSKDGRDFQMIGTREGSGTSLSLKHYSFTHEQPDVGTNYYRLKQLDLNGSFEYSKLVIIEYKDSNQWIEIFPNPTFDKVNFIVSTELEGSFEVYNQTGQLIQEEKNINSEKSISLQGLPTGWYIIKLKTNRGGSTHRVFKH